MSGFGPKADKPISYTWVGVWCTVGITFEGNSGNGDDRTLGQPLVQIGIFGLAFSQREPPPIIMDHDCNVIRIVEGRCATIERRIIEVPLRRSKLPNELRKIVPVFVVACPAAFGGKIKLVPPFELSHFVCAPFVHINSGRRRTSKRLPLWAISR